MGPRKFASRVHVACFGHSERKFLLEAMSHRFRHRSQRLAAAGNGWQPMAAVDRLSADSLGHQSKEFRDHSARIGI